MSGSLPENLQRQKDIVLSISKPVTRTANRGLGGEGGGGAVVTVLVIF